MTLFVGLRAEVSKSRVETTSIVERFDVGEDIGARLVSGAVDGMVNALAFQAAEEALHRGIVVPTAGSVHAAPNTVVLQQRLEPWIRPMCMGGVLDSVTSDPPE